MSWLRVPGRLAALLLPLAGCVSAPPPAPTLVDVFRVDCLDRFPADPPASARLQPMPAAQVRGGLRIASGRGWVDHRPDGDLIVSLEDAPVKACAVRHLDHAATPVQPALRLVVAEWAARTGRGAPRPGPSIANAQGGRVIEGEAELVPSPNGARDLITALVTRYPDGGVETRLVHQVAPAGR